MPSKDVETQLKGILNEYEEKVQTVTDRSITVTAKEAVNKLKNTSPKQTGDYAKGWAVKKEGRLTQTVYNRTDWQLTHLLNNGHIVRNKYGTYGRVPGDNHIGEVEQWAADELVLRISRGLN